MKALKKTFKKCFGIPFPEALLPKGKLFPQYKATTKDPCLLYGSRSAIKKPLLIEGDKAYLSSRPEGYFLTGFWGHGVNSYAFYYSRVDSWSKIFFRLPYGGVYMDNKKGAKDIRNFLLKYIPFEEKLKTMVKSFTAIDSMGDGDYIIVLSDGRELGVATSILTRPHIFQYLLKKSAQKESSKKQ